MFLFIFLVLNKCNINTEASLNFKLTHFILLFFWLCWDTSSELWARKKALLCLLTFFLKAPNEWRAHILDKGLTAVSQALANVSLCHLSGVWDCYSSFFYGWRTIWEHTPTSTSSQLCSWLSWAGFTLASQFSQDSYSQPQAEVQMGSSTLGRYSRSVQHWKQHYQKTHIPKTKLSNWEKGICSSWFLLPEQILP